MPVEDEDDPEMPPPARPPELGRRLLHSAVAVAAAFLLCYPLAPRIYAFLAAPLARAYEGTTPADPRMIFTGLAEAFPTYVRVALWAASFLAFPFVAVQLGMLVAPGPRRGEGALLPFLVATPCLFFAGGAFLYFGLLPVAAPLLPGLQPPAGVDGPPIPLDAPVGEYLGLVMRLILGFGLAFEMPVALAFLGRAGVLTGDGLRRGRPRALVALLVAAAALAAPSVPGQGALALTMLLLYEASIALVRRAERAGARP